MFPWLELQPDFHYTFTELTHTSQNKAADFGIRQLQETGLVSGSRLSC